MGILKEIFNKRIEYGDYHLDCRTRGLSLSNPNWDTQPRDSAGQWAEGGGGGDSGGKAPAANSGGNKAIEPVSAPTPAPSTPPPDAAKVKGDKKAITKDLKAIAKSVDMKPEELVGKQFPPGTLEAYGHDESEDELAARGILTKNAAGNFELAAQVLEHIGEQAKLREQFSGKAAPVTQHTPKAPTADPARASYDTPEKQAAAIKTLLDRYKQYHPTATGANYDGKHITAGAIPAAYTGYSAAELEASGAIKEVGETDSGEKVYELSLSHGGNGVTFMLLDDDTEIENADGSFSLVI